MRIPRGPAVALTLVLALSGCGDDDTSFSPTVENVAGDYTASVFTLDVGAGVINQLVQGASVSVTLAPDGTTAGRLFLPGGAANGGDLDADLTGTWSLSRGGVTFDQTSDTFIRDVRFEVDRNRLIGEDWSGHQVISLVLQKPEVAARQ